MSALYDDAAEIALEAARKAASILKGYFHDGVDSIEKSDDGQPQGLVTVADLEAESTIISTIQDAFPDHAFLPEESARTGDNPDHLWVIDPLDGTNNFAFGIPHFATSVAYWHHGQPAVGVIIDPIKDETFVAVSGQGATLNGKNIDVNDRSEVSESIIATGFYYDRGDMMKRTLRSIETLFVSNVRGIRRMGAASLDIAYVACGRYGVFFEYTLSPWDFAAGCLILTEAGGTFTDCNGNVTGLSKTSALATNGKLHSQMLSLLRAEA